MFKKTAVLAAAAITAACILVSCANGDGTDTSSARSNSSRESSRDVSREVSRETSRTPLPDITSRVNSDPTVSGLYSGEENVIPGVSQ